MLKRFILIFLSLLVCFPLLAKEEYPFLGLVTNDNINVRAGANVNFETLCKLAKNEKVTVVEKNYNWYKIVLPQDATCYINERYVAAEDSLGLVTANRVNIRAKPSDNSSIIGQINKNEKVKILKKTGQWYGIEPIENSFGWVHEKFIRYQSAFKKDSPVTLEAVKESQKSEAKIKPSVTIENEAIKKEAVSIGGTVSAVGVVEPMGRVLNRAGTHKLIYDGKIIYILSGERNKLDNAINYRVKIVGEKKITSSSKYPVLTVKQITVLLNE